MQEHNYLFEGDFELESGYVYPELNLGYHTVGTLNEQKNNVVWICHAFSANSNVDDWWSGALSNLKILNPLKQFIICVNIPGSCYGSTGPLSINPKTQNPYLHDFEYFSIRDVVKSFILLADSLEIPTIHMLIGGSLGGQQALEWAIMQPDRIEKLVISATNASHSAWGIAFNESQRMAIQADQTWLESQPKAGLEGMKVARSIGLLSYRNYQTYVNSQTDPITETFPEIRKAAAYQQYQGHKLATRFNAFSYFALTQTMDSHHVGRGRGGEEAALQKIIARTLVIGIKSDILFPVEEQKFLAKNIPQASYYEIDSPFGHDGFLIEKDAIGESMGAFFSIDLFVNA